MKLLKCKPTDLRGHRLSKGDYVEVTYATSYTYNGGIGVGDEWYDGFEVPAPLLNPDHAIIGIGVGLQLNARPPQATGVLMLKSEVKDRPYMGCDGLWKRDRME
jgi:hypothetical protein